MKRSRPIQATETGVCPGTQNRKGASLARIVLAPTVANPLCIVRTEFAIFARRTDRKISDRIEVNGTEHA